VIFIALAILILVVGFMAYRGMLTAESIGWGIGEFFSSLLDDLFH
jgi:hypothetical protein